MTALKIIFVFIFMAFKFPRSSVSPHIFKYIEFPIPGCKILSICWTPVIEDFQSSRTLCLTSVWQPGSPRSHFLYLVPEWGVWDGLTLLKVLSAPLFQWQNPIPTVGSTSLGSGVSDANIHVEACCLFSGDSLDSQWHLEHDSINQMSTPVTETNRPWSKGLWLLWEPLVSCAYGHIWVRYIYTQMRHLYFHIHLRHLIFFFLLSLFFLPHNTLFSAGSHRCRDGSPFL